MRFLQFISQMFIALVILYWTIDKCKHDKQAEKVPTYWDNGRPIPPFFPLERYYINMAKLQSGEIVPYQLAQEASDSMPVPHSDENWQYIGRGVIYSRNGVLQNDTLGNLTDFFILKAIGL